MTGIASTTANLALWRLQWETLFSLPHLLDETELDDQDGCRLTEVAAFGANPGNLRMFSYVPRDLPPMAPLVVVLHGCTQTAALYDKGSGWSRLADEAGFALVFAQQRNENNPRRCFNWFRPSDFTRDSGEAASIRQMVRVMVETHALDPARIFATGLSAGGAMTNVMLAAYPDVFAAGAVIAGLPYRAASSVHDALKAMLEGIVRSPQARGDAVRDASPPDVAIDSAGNYRWPRVAVWQGLADETVRPVNATEIVKQWADVHGFDEAAGVEDSVAGSKRMRWRDSEGNVVIEAVAIADLGHAVPVAGRAMAHPVPYFSNVGLSSTREIARFFGLLPAAGAPSNASSPHADTKHKPNGAEAPAAPSRKREPARSAASAGKKTKPQPAPQPEATGESTPTKSAARESIATENVARENVDGVADALKLPPLRMPEAAKPEDAKPEAVIPPPTRAAPPASLPAPAPAAEPLLETGTAGAQETALPAKGQPDLQSSGARPPEGSPAGIGEGLGAPPQTAREGGKAEAGRMPDMFAQSLPTTGWLTPHRRRKIAAVVPQIMKLLGLSGKK